MGRQMGWEGRQLDPSPLHPSSHPLHFALPGVCLPPATCSPYCLPSLKFLSGDCTNSYLPHHCMPCCCMLLCCVPLCQVSPWPGSHITACLCPGSSYLHAGSHADLYLCTGSHAIPCFCPCIVLSHASAPGPSLSHVSLLSLMPPRASMSGFLLPLLIEGTAFSLGTQF